MKNRILLVVILTGILQLSFGQKSTFIGFEGAVTSDIYEIIDPCNIIQNTPLITGSWGFTIGQEIWDTRKVQPGVYLFTLKTSGIQKSGKLFITK